MLLHSQNADSIIIKSNMGESSPFNIATNGKGFRILSDTLYQDKIGSIVREISCNAVDAHIAAGTPDLPFEIHLPSVFEPWFSVKDFGVGLSDEDIRTIYTTLFKSTKDTNNDMIGAFGLGSKTPFSYTDNFTITSIFNGVKRTYAAIIQNDGMPTINLLKEEPTDEHNGLEVHLAVKKEDISAFRLSARKELHYFTVRPKVVNGGDFSFAPIQTPVGKFGNISLFEKYPGHNSTFTVIQGGVAYPLNIELVKKGITRNSNDPKNGDYKELLSFISTLRHYYTELSLPIGSVEVTPSREAISYNTRTNNEIIESFATAHAALLDQINALMGATDYTIWEKACSINKFHYLTRSMDFSQYGFKVRDHGIAYFRISHDGDIFDSKFRVTKFYPRVNRANKKVISSTNITLTYSDIGASSDVRFFHVPLNSKKVRTRVRHLLGEAGSGVSAVYLIEPVFRGEVGKDVKVDICDITENDLSKISQNLGNVEIGNINDIPLPLTKSRRKSSTGERIRNPTARYFKYRGEGGLHISNFDKVFTPVSDIKDGGVYILLEKGQRNIDVQPISESYIIGTAIELGIIDKNKIYVIRWSDEGLVKDNPKWKSIDELNEIITAYIRNDHKTMREIAFTIAVARSPLTDGYELLLNNTRSGLLNKVARRTVRADRLEEKFGITTYKSHRFFNEVEIRRITDAFLDKIKQEMNRIRKEFPLLKALAWYSGDGDESEVIKQHLIEYVNGRVDLDERA